MARASPIQSSFNAGRLSKKLAGRVDVAKYGGGAKQLENFIPVIQGPLQRRSGGRYMGPIKDSTKQSWLVKFEFNIQQVYQLEFGVGYIRFFTNHGQVAVSGVAAWNIATNYVVGDLVSRLGVNYYCILANVGNQPPNATFWYPLTGSIYEIPTPYTAADLTAADGTFKLGLVESADIIYIASALHAPMKLSRLGATNWTLTTVQPDGGPFKTINTTAVTVYANAATGAAVTLTASAATFVAGDIGSLFYLGQKTVLSVLQWEAGKAVAAGVMRRSDGKNYLSVNAATTGGSKPIHSEGSVYDGDTGVQWTFLDPGYGYGIITAVASPVSATLNVIDRLPDNAVLIANASTKWAKALFSDVEGWPTVVTFFKERLCLFRGQDFAISVAADYENFHTKDDGGVITADMSIVGRISSDTVNNVAWAMPSDALLVGTAGGEFAIKPLTEQEPFGPANVQSVPVSSYGSKATAPSRVGEVILFVQRSGLKLRDILYDFVSNGFKSFDQNSLSDDITAGGILQLAYQQEPYSIEWAARADGRLIAMTYSREQYADPPYGGWHMHRLGGSGIVESVLGTPNPDGDGDELTMIVRRTINGATLRSVEYMEREFRDTDDPEDAFYVDCGLTLNNTIAQTLTPGAGAVTQYQTGVNFAAGGAVFVLGDVGREIHVRYSTIDDEDQITWVTSKALITAFVNALNVTCTIQVPFQSAALIASGGWRMTVTTVTGLSHLEGQTVDVLADGLKHPQVVVTGGAITLQQIASKVQVGLPMPARVQTMRLNAGSQDGTSQGKTARINKLVLRFLNTLGGRIGKSFDPDEMTELDFRTPLDAMDNPVPLYTGDIVEDFPGDYDSDPWVCYEQPDPLPCTLVAVMPTVSVYDRG